ncbi:MAG: tRNA pseudouridine(55) synthase TruB [Fimbriimonas sp.]|nr:tRNA pseudouridine(55) synthase TruB [Fimbriimonas sp.]
MLGILLIRKPLRITSHDVVNDVRRRFSTKRVGHAGTLDPLATGVLVVAVGPATRFLQYLPLEPKVYVADICFGRSTTTFDAEGEPSLERPVPVDLAGAIQKALPSFTGLIQQFPPMFSAVKVGGRPLYQYARSGKSVEREARTVHITSFEILECSNDSAKARIICSGGTYIRSLANDLGEQIGCGGYLAGLVRTQVGRFTLDEAVPLEEIAPNMLRPLSEVLPPMPMVQLDDVQTAFIREGRPIALHEAPSYHLAALLEPDGTVFSVARVTGNLLQPECVIPSGVLDVGI